MPGLSEQDTEQIVRALHATKKPDGSPAFTDDEILQAVDDMDVAAGAPLAPGESGGPRAALEGTQTIARFLGPFLGGSIGSSLAARSTPLVQAAAEGGGTILGDIAGRFASNTPQNLKESVGMGAVSGVTGGVTRGLAKIVGEVGGVAPVATMEAGKPNYGMVPAYNKTYGNPSPGSVSQVMRGESSESGLLDRLNRAVRSLRSRITPERARKVAILKQADQAGVRVPADEMIDALKGQLINDPSVPHAQAFNAALTKTIDNFTARAAKTGGSLTPSEIDEIIRRELNPKAFTQAGDPSMSMLGTALRDAETAATESLNRVLPPKVAELNTKISERLNMMEDADRYYGADRGSVIGRIKNLYTSGHEPEIPALQFLAKESGDKKLADDVFKNFVQRQFSPDIRAQGDAPGRPIRAIFEGGARQATRASAPLQPFVGPAAAGTLSATGNADVANPLIDAFTAAMDASNGTLPPLSGPQRYYHGRPVGP